MQKLIFILDKSGSMGSIVPSVIQGYNQYLADQREVPAEADFTLVQFNSNAETAFQSVPIHQVANLDKLNYRPFGSTALYRTVVETIQRQQAFVNEGDQVIIAIMTDGQDTDDRNGLYRSMARELIGAKREEGWQFIFLGANIDVQQYADNLGIDQQYSYAFTADAQGTVSGYARMSDTTRSLRGTCL